MLTLADAPVNSWQRCSSHGTLVNSPSVDTLYSMAVPWSGLHRRINIKIRASLRHAAETRYPRESDWFCSCVRELVAEAAREQRERERAGVGRLVDLNLDL